uniref:C-type lectin domain-containing protein n=1 Tax=Gouania willdenowi TaxID=441366 RepID=A0A8C5G5Z2_GOUWI
GNITTELFCTFSNTHDKLDNKIKVEEKVTVYVQQWALKFWSQLDPKVFFVNSYETWPVAQKYCRENYVDLVTVTNIKVVEKINSETGGSKVWIGLHRAPNFFWSDGSNFTFSNWDSVANELNSVKVICAVTSSTMGGKWKFLSCEEKLPFVCYSLPHG